MELVHAFIEIAPAMLVFGTLTAFAVGVLFGDKE